MTKSGTILSGRESVGSFGGPVYLDASILVKLYLPEADSLRIGRALDGRRDILLSELTITEVVSVIARVRREGSVGAKGAGDLHQKILHDVESGMFQRLSLEADDHRLAERLLLGMEAPLRAADALHLALALNAGAATIFSTDRRLAGAALSSGIAVFP